MIDYFELKDLTETEIINIGDSIIAEQNEIVDRYNAMSEKERKNNAAMRERHELLEFKWYSLRDVLWFKQGNIEVKLYPEGIEYPVDYSQKENGIKKLIKTIFNKITDKNSK